MKGESKIFLTITLSVILIVVSSLLFILNYGEELDVKPNIILVTLESTRADHLPCYGYHRNTTPNLCSVAEDGILFEQAYSQGSHTVMSIPSLITSEPPTVGLATYRENLPNEYTTLAENLKSKGFYTAADLWLERFDDQGFAQGMDITVHSSYLKMEDEALDLLFEEEEGVHYWYFSQPPHFPYKPSDDFLGKYSELNLSGEEIEEKQFDLLNGGNLKFDNLPDKIKNETVNLYDEELLMTDHKIGNFFDKLKEEEIYEDSLIIITSDHGQFLGEYNRVQHGGTPYEEVINVPLIIKLPENQKSGTRVQQSVRLLDIKPTIYDYLGNMETEQYYGSSLLPAIEGENLNLTIIASDSPKRKWMIREDNYKYFLENVDGYCLNDESPENEMLFNIYDDPQEDENIITEYPGKSEKLRDELCKIYSVSLKRRYETEMGELTEDEKDKLKELGYLG